MGVILSAGSVDSLGGIALLLPLKEKARSVKGMNALTTLSKFWKLTHNIFSKTSLKMRTERLLKFLIKGLIYSVN